MDNDVSDISQREDVRKRPILILPELYNTYLWRFKFSLNARERHFQILDSHDGKNTYVDIFSCFPRRNDLDLFCRGSTFFLDKEVCLG